MKLFENVSKKKGLCQTFFSKCSNCLASKTFRSSNKVSPNGAFDINLKSVHPVCIKIYLHQKMQLGSLFF